MKCRCTGLFRKNLAYSTCPVIDEDSSPWIARTRGTEADFLAGQRWLPGPNESIDLHVFRLFGASRPSEPSSVLKLSNEMEPVMADTRDVWSLNPNVPTVYISYGGVLHVGEGLIDNAGTITLDSGSRPFEFAAYLADLLAPYPNVQIILTTASVATLGEARTAALLPPELSARVVGTTLLYPPRMGEVRSGTGRTMSILRHAAACGIKTWLAVGDDLYGIPVGEERHFLHVPPGTRTRRGWCSPRAQCMACGECVVCCLR